MIGSIDEGLGRGLSYIRDEWGDVHTVGATGMRNKFLE
jgi:hypothetical protein